MLKKQKFESPEKKLQNLKAKLNKTDLMIGRLSTRVAGLQRSLDGLDQGIKPAAIINLKGASVLR